jgi:hypothetical protein
MNGWVMMDRATSEKCPAVDFNLRVQKLQALPQTLTPFVFTYIFKNFNKFLYRNFLFGI